MFGLRVVTPWSFTNNPVAPPPTDTNQIYRFDFTMSIARFCLILALTFLRF